MTFYDESNNNNNNNGAIQKQERHLLCNQKFSNELYQYFKTKALYYDENDNSNNNNNNNQKLCPNNVFINVASNQMIDGNGMLPFNSFLSSGIHVFGHNNVDSTLNAIFTNYNERNVDIPNAILDVVEIEKETNAGSNCTLMLKISCSISKL